LIVAIPRHQPTRRFWQEEHGSRQESTEHDLECDRETPCEIWGACLDGNGSQQ
jgi:hypothetical protein